jgi:hypothetical protein
VFGSSTSSEDKYLISAKWMDDWHKFIKPDLSEKRPPGLIDNQQIELLIR